MARRWAIACVLVTGVAAASAQPADGPPPQLGPALVALGDGIEVDLPAGMALRDGLTARNERAAAGEPIRGVLGEIVPVDGAAWSVQIAWAPVGHVVDRDADQLDPRAFLATLTRKTLDQNAFRRAQGEADLVVDGWATPPTYDRARRTLRWALATHAADRHRVVETAIVLGRQGFVALTAVATDADGRVRADAAMAAVRFQAGARYDDYDAKRDGGVTLGLRAVTGQVPTPARPHGDRALGAYRALVGVAVLGALVFAFFWRRFNARR
jgi:uncharacterized membrane-anchored protein